MKKFFLLLLAVIAAMPLTLKAESPADIFTWTAGPTSPGTPMGPDNTVTVLAGIYGRVPSNVKLEIPGTSATDPYQIKGEKGETLEQDMTLLSNSLKRVRVIGPGVPGGSTTKNIGAIYSTTAGVWPPEFNKETGRQECIGLKVGFYSYETIKEPGTYILEFPEGAFYINGEPNEEFELEINVNDTRTFTPKYLEFDVDPFVAPYELDELVEPRLFLNNYEETSDGGWKEIYTSKGIAPQMYATISKDGGEPKNCKVINPGGSISRLQWLVQIDPENNNVIKEPGTYKVVIPQGIIRLEDNSNGMLYCNQYLSYTFIVKDPNGGDNPDNPDNPDDPNKDKNIIDVTPGVSPLPGTVTALQSIQLTMPKGYQMFVPSPATPFTMSTPDGKTTEVTPREGWTGHYVFLDFAEPFTTPGEYTLTIPSKGLCYFTATEDGETITDSKTQYFTEEQTFKYNVTWGEEGDMDLTFSPADGSTVYKFDGSIYVNIPGSFTPTLGMFADAKYPDGSSKQIKVTFPSTGGRAMMSLNFPEERGEYEITVPAGIVRTEDGKINKETKCTINYAEIVMEDVPLQTNPANGTKVNALDRIDFVVPEGYTQMELRDGGVTMSYMNYPNGTREMNYIREQSNEFFVDLKTKVTYSEETKGDYELTIPETNLLFTKTDGQVVTNTALRFVWTLSEVGIVEVATGDGMVTVYDMTGRMLLRNVPEDQLGSLDKGVYIVNGVKTVIR